MKIKWKPFGVALLLPLVVGGFAGLLTSGSMKLFASLNQPPFSPPGWLFPVVWTLLYALMGAASYLVFVAPAPDAMKRAALTAYLLQLAVNFLWPILFFNARLYLIALLWLGLLWLLVLWTLILFGRLTKLAELFLLPYLLWVTFAFYLNLGVFLLN